MDNSINYIPKNQRDDPLFKKACELIDIMMKNGEEDLQYLIVDELVKDIIRDYRDEKALAAYYNTFIRPVLGTGAAFRFLLDLLNIDAEFKEWHEMEWPIPPYKLVIDCGENFPKMKHPKNPWIDWDKLLSLFFSLKNERTVLATFRMDDCANMLNLDYGNLDRDKLDTMSGYKYRGVLFCLYEKHNELIQYTGDFSSQVNLDQLNTGVRCRHYIHAPPHSLDYYMFGEDVDNVRPIEFMRTGLTSQQIKINQPSPEAYRWQTLVTQLVFDDFGTLSDSEGLGFPISLKHLTNDINLSEYSFGDISTEDIVVDTRFHINNDHKEVESIQSTNKSRKTVRDSDFDNSKERKLSSYVLSGYIPEFINIIGEHKQEWVYYWFGMKFSEFGTLSGGQGFMDTIEYLDGDIELSSMKLSGTTQEQFLYVNFTESFNDLIDETQFLSEKHYSNSRCHDTVSPFMDKPSMGYNHKTITIY